MDDRELETRTYVWLNCMHEGVAYLGGGGDHTPAVTGGHGRVPAEIGAEARREWRPPLWPRPAGDGRRVDHPRQRRSCVGSSHVAPTAA